MQAPRPRLLIVDDDRSVTASLALLLKQAGLESLSVGSPDEALDVLRQKPCQLVIQDMNFTRRTSGEEGLTLLREIKSQRPELPVMMVTAYGDDERRRLASTYSAAEFINKPVDFDLLKKQLQDLPARPA